MNVVDRLIEMDRDAPKRVLVIGDRMTDLYIYGTVSPTCQEGCPKFVEQTRIRVAGGAANAARSLSGWSGGAVCLGATEAGPRKTRFLVNDRCVWRHDDEMPYDAYYQDVYRKESLNLIRDSKCDAVLLSDYDKGTLTVEYIEEISSSCSDRMPCVVDCKRAPDVYAYHNFVLKCNAEYQGKYNQRLAELVYAAVSWRKPHHLVVTAGADNPIVWDGGGPVGLGYNLPKVPCVNHVGAGDCFGAHLALALAHGFSLPDAARVAHSAGRVYVQHRHNRPPQPAEISADMGRATGGH